MQYRHLRLAILSIAVSLVGACATVPRDHGRTEVAGLLAERTGTAALATPQADSEALSAALVAETLAEPLTAASAIRIALLRNPRLQSAYAELGIARADLIEAARLSNPTLSYAHLDRRGGGHQAIAGITQSIADLLLLPARKRLATGEFRVAQQTVAAALFDLVGEVDAAVISYAAAAQIAHMRAALCVAAEAAAELAQRFFAAGNIDELQLKLEQAALSEARLAVLRADAETAQARLALNALLGLTGAEGDWRGLQRLAVPVSIEDSLPALLTTAREQRLDLAAARERVLLRDSALTTTRRWRWLGAVEIGFEREDEGGGDVSRGPGLAVELPIFNQGQGALAHAEAKLAEARAELRRLEAEVEFDVRLAVDRVDALRGIAEQYRAALIPQREAIVARQQERVNFMLVGVFELIRAKQQEYDAYQGYLETVRDYWLARSALSSAIGTRLPSDAIEVEGAAVDATLQPPPANDPHAGHRMSEKDATPASEPTPKQHDHEDHQP